MGGRALWLGITLLALVPSAARAQEKVPVAARDLVRGVALSEEDIEYRPPSGKRGGEPGEAGWVTRRVIRAGEELRHPAVARPQVVGPGEPVEVRWSGEGVTLSLRGVAASGAGEGEKVWVRVDQGWRLEGVVVGPAMVEIQSPGRAK